MAAADVPLALAWGRAIADRWALPETNVLSHVHHDYPVQLDKWLFQLGAYWTHCIAGTFGLVLLRIALLATALYAAAKAVRIRWDWAPHALLMVLFTIALLNRPYVRAELVTWAATPLTLCLIPAIARGDKKGWALLVLAQALWANSHGYWVIGPLLWLAIGTGAAVQPLLARTALARRRPPRPAPERLRLLSAVPVAIVASCLTPYGVKTLAHPLKLVWELERTEILRQALGDFRTPWEVIGTGASISLWICLGLGLTAIVSAAWLAKRKRLEGEKLALLGTGLILGLPYFRNLTILALCSLPLVADGVRLAMAGSRGRVKQRWRYAVVAAPVALLWTVLAHAGWKPACDYGMRVPGFGWREGNYPIAAADWIAEHAPNAKLWNDLTSGGWYAWRLGEGRTSIDGNTDGYPLDWLPNWHQAHAGFNLEMQARLAPEDLVALRTDHWSGRSNIAAHGFRGGLSDVAYFDGSMAVFAGSAYAHLEDRDAAAKLARALRAWIDSGQPNMLPWWIEGESVDRFLDRILRNFERTRAGGGLHAPEWGNAGPNELLALARCYPEQPVMWSLLARARDLDGDLSGAKEAWEQAIELLPRGPERLKAKAALHKLQARMRDD